MPTNTKTTSAKKAAKKAATRAVRSAASATSSTARKSTRANKRTSKRASSGGSDDAIAVLKSDHREVEQLFKRFEDLGSSAHKTRESTVAKMIEALAKHAAVEEEILYPEIRARLKRDQEDLVLEALEEHHVVKWTLSELEKMRSTDERYTAKVTVLTESVRHHVKEEEGELFPQVRNLFSRSELDEMGARLKAAKKRAPTRPHPRAPDEPPGNILANTLTAPLDATAKVAETAAKVVRRAVPG